MDSEGLPRGGDLSGDFRAEENESKQRGRGGGGDQKVPVSCEVQGWERAPPVLCDWSAAHAWNRCVTSGKS